MEGRGPEAEIRPLKAAEGGRAGSSAGGSGPGGSPRGVAAGGGVGAGAGAAVQANGAPKERGLPAKAGRLSRWRTGAFFLSLFLCLLVVLAFSFAIPCPVRPVSQRTWSRSYEDAAAYPFLAVADVDGDRVQDILFAFQAAAGHLNGSSSPPSNSSCSEAGFAPPCAFLAAHSGTNGSLLWERPVGQDLLLLECLLEPEESAACLLVGRPGFLASLDLMTGQTRWQQALDLGANFTVLSPLLKLPDVDKDDVPDLMLCAAAGEEVRIFFRSGEDGHPIGSTKSLPLPGCRGHLMHVTQSGAHYVLFYSAMAAYAFSVEELFRSALALGDHHSVVLWEDPHWEMAVDRATHQLSFLSSGEILSLTEVAGANILVARSDMLELVDGRRLGSVWVADIPRLRREPVLGSFYPDEVDVLVESQVSPHKKKVLMVGGPSGDIEWEVDLLSREGNPKAASLNTADHRSAFLFWGLYPEHENKTVPLGDTQEPQRLYLLHPSLPDVLLEMSNTSEAILAFQGVLFERSRHACYVLLTGPAAGSPPGRVGLLKRKLKEDVAGGRALWLSRLPRDSEQAVRDRFLRLRFRSLH